MHFGEIASTVYYGPTVQAGALEIEDLVVAFRSDAGEVRPVDGVSFSVPKGATVGLVGESGSGKSVTSLSVMGLLPAAGRIVSGSIRFEGTELTKLDERRYRALRGARLSLIFQEPMTALNPVLSVGEQVIEALRAHQPMSRKDARARTVELFRQVGMAAPEERVDAYPHQLSGGMRQRVMIAMALALGPSLLIADEPTTALDATIQAQILDLIASLSRASAMSVLLITHDLGVVVEHTQVVVVMYAGKVVERAKTRELFARPLHPYTQGLLRSVPSYPENIGKRRLPTIAGNVPDLSRLPVGCRFQERCPSVMERCRREEPALRVRGERAFACHLEPS